MATGDGVRLPLTDPLRLGPKGEFFGSLNECLLMTDIVLDVASIEASRRMARAEGLFTGAAAAEDILLVIEMLARCTS